MPYGRYSKPIRPKPYKLIIFVRKTDYHYPHNDVNEVHRVQNLKLVYLYSVPLAGCNNIVTVEVKVHIPAAFAELDGATDDNR